MNGNVLTITQTLDTNQQLTELIESVYFAYPVLFAFELADPPTVNRVDGQVGEVKFRWELKNWKARFEVTTQEKQERTVVLSWQRQTRKSAVTRCNGLLSCSASSRKAG